MIKCKQGFFHGLLLSCIFGLSLVPYLAQAEIYKIVDKNGKVSFSDQPAPEAEAVNISPLNTTPAVKQRPVKADTATLSAPPSLYNTLTISNPKDQQVIPNGLVSLTVSAQINPSLQEKHTLALSIDGQPHSTSRDQFTINGITRGPHQLQISAIDEEGNILIRSTPIEIFVYRPSN